MHQDNVGNFLTGLMGFHAVQKFWTFFSPNRYLPEVLIELQKGCKGMKNVKIKPATKMKISINQSGISSLPE